MKVDFTQAVILMVVVLIVFYLVVKNLYWLYYNILKSEYDKQDIYHLVEIAESEFEKGHLHKAKKIVKHILKQKKDEMSAQVLLAKIVRAEGNVRKARQILENILDTYPNHSKAKMELEKIHAET